MKATAWNTGWLFRHLDSQENFVPVTLPHDAMQAEPRTELSANGINGGWYEGRDYEYIRRFTPDKSLRSKTLMLEFEGVYHLAEVYLNGEKVAERPYGYTNFYADLTDRVRFDEENELRVIARNSDQPNSRWYSGAGIYRPVVLWTADKQQHIARTAFASARCPSSRDGGGYRAHRRRGARVGGCACGRSRLHPPPRTRRAKSP
ncbi:MAG: sugar-binding domain-containing protein [Christensenellales bacterium]